MTTPSRKNEIQRRRTRRGKIALLRRHYEKASSEVEREKITEKLKRISPGLSVEDFLKPLANRRSVRGQP